MINLFLGLLQTLLSTVNRTSCSLVCLALVLPYFISACLLISGLDLQTRMQSECSSSWAQTFEHNQTHRAGIIGWKQIKIFSDYTLIKEVKHAGDPGFVSQKDPLETEMATPSSSLVWRIPWDRGAWWATVHGVPESWTWLSDLTW